MGEGSHMVRGEESAKRQRPARIRVRAAITPMTVRRYGRTMRLSRYKPDDPFVRRHESSWHARTSVGRIARLEVVVTGKARIRNRSGDLVRMRAKGG